MRSWKTGMIAVIGGVTLGLLLTTASTSHAAGESAAQFYKDKTITWIVASRAGGPTDLLARILAPVLAKETGAKVRVENMGSEEGVNWVYNQGSKDGLTMLCKSTDAIVNNDLLKAPGVQYEAEKYLYIADIGPDANMLFVTAKSKYQSLDDLRKAKGLKLGATSAKGSLSTNGAVALEILGLDAKVITGYRGAKGVVQAMLTGEVELIVIRASALSAQVKSGDLRGLFSIAAVRSGALPDVPTLEEIGVKVPPELEDARSASDVGGTTAAMPPGVPPERVEYMRALFDKMSQDKGVQANMEKLTGLYSPFIPGKKLQASMTRMKANKVLGKQLGDILAKYRTSK
ncbi:MAG: tripartite tricarboxylate transporter substrate-binding protein [Desulfobacterales bacterium]|nr:tripartite tricarboxylate transporter substrate-binding protein [Desulfobacterales bacterium]